MLDKDKGKRGSTKLLLDTIEKENVFGKHFLETGQRVIRGLLSQIKNEDATQDTRTNTTDNEEANIKNEKENITKEDINKSTTLEINQKKREYRNDGQDLKNDNKKIKIENKKIKKIKKTKKTKNDNTLHNYFSKSVAR